jgi:hypothetical protein
MDLTKYQLDPVINNINSFLSEPLQCNHLFAARALGLPISADDAYNFIMYKLYIKYPQKCTITDCIEFVKTLEQLSFQTITFKYTRINLIKDLDELKLRRLDPRYRIIDIPDELFIYHMFCKFKKYYPNLLKRYLATIILTKENSYSFIIYSIYMCDFNLFKRLINFTTPDMSNIILTVGSIPIIKLYIKNHQIKMLSSQLIGMIYTNQSEKNCTALRKFLIPEFADIKYLGFTHTYIVDLANKKYLQSIVDLKTDIITNNRIFEEDYDNIKYRTDVISFGMLDIKCILFHKDSRVLDWFVHKIKSERRVSNIFIIILVILERTPYDKIKPVMWKLYYIMDALSHDEVKKIKEYVCNYKTFKYLATKICYVGFIAKYLGKEFVSINNFLECLVKEPNYFIYSYNLAPYITFDLLRNFTKAYFLVALHYYKAINTELFTRCMLICIDIDYAANYLIDTEYYTQLFNDYAVVKTPELIKQILSNYKRFPLSKVKAFANYFCREILHRRQIHGYIKNIMLNTSCSVENVAIYINKREEKKRTLYLEFIQYQLDNFDLEEKIQLLNLIDDYREKIINLIDWL